MVLRAYYTLQHIFISVCTITGIQNRVQSHFWGSGALSLNEFHI